MVKNHRGQSLVEVALLAPVFLFVVATLIQLLLLIRMQIVLQGIAGKVGHEVSCLGHPETTFAVELARDFRHSLLFGYPVPHYSVRHKVNSRWATAYRAQDTVAWSGELIETDVSYQFYPRFWLGRMVFGRQITARCVLPVQPTVPAEG